MPPRSPVPPFSFALSRLASVVAIGALATGAAFAQSTTEDPRELSETASKAYAQGLQTARAQIASKHYDEATATLSTLSSERPREIQARFLLGTVQSDQGKIDEALATFRGLLADYPELSEARNNLAVLYAQKGEYALARDELERAVQTSPDYAVAHENLGDVYARLAELEYQRTSDIDKRNKTASIKLKLVRDATATH